MKHPPIALLALFLYLPLVAADKDKPLPKDFKSLKALAEKGDALAQNNLGLMYGTGQGVDQNFKEAVKWFQKAADQGNANAQCSLGQIFSGNLGLGEEKEVKQDFKEAVKWYQKAADQGDALAQYNLGVIYRDGQGVEQDFKEAVKWYQKAADQGYAIAQYVLGFMYANGQGVERNFVNGYAWWNIAASNGEQNAKKGLPQLVKLMIPAQIAKAEELVKEMVKKNPKLLNKK